MTTIYGFFLVFFVLPVALASGYRLAFEHGLITISPRVMLTGKIKTLGAEVYFAAAVVLCIAALIFLFFYLAAGGYLPVWFRWSVLLLITASTLTLCIITFKAPQIYKLSPTIFNIVGSFATFLLVFVAGIYSDAHLAWSIGVTGTDLPAAQRAVTIMLSLVAWAVAFTFVALFLYLITALVWMAHSIRIANASRKRLSSLMCSGGGTQRNEKDKGGIYLTLFVGLAFTALIPINAVEEVTKDKRLERWANELTVFASFHMGEHPCFPEALDGTRFGLIDADRVVAATPDAQLGYTYELRHCKTPADK